MNHDVECRWWLTMTTTKKRKREAELRIQPGGGGGGDLSGPQIPRELTATGPSSHPDRGPTGPVHIGRRSSPNRTRERYGGVAVTVDDDDGAVVVVVVVAPAW
jgi:hypothetical protein